jgi:SAM-dependent methyltransferase
VADNGWDASASAWIDSQGSDGDWMRRWVLDPVMAPAVERLAPRAVLDVGCGEGRFCRVIRRDGRRIVGVDLTLALVAAARQRDADGSYVRALGERLPFANGRFDLVISYLALIDIDDVDAAIAEMARVTAPGGTLLVAHLNGFTTACADRGWVRSLFGRRLHYRLDHYLDDRAMWVSWRGIRIRNHHRPLSRYMTRFLDLGLRLMSFDEPGPVPTAPEPKASGYRRAPYACVMEWRKP